jgi:hypothetical protein
MMVVVMMIPAIRGDRDRGTSCDDDDDVVMMPPTVMVI